MTTRLFAVLLPELGMASVLLRLVKLLPYMLLFKLGRLTAGFGCCERNAAVRVGNRTLLPISAIFAVPSPNSLAETLSSNSRNTSTIKKTNVHWSEWQVAVIQKGSLSVVAAGFAERTLRCPSGVLYMTL